MSLCHSRIRVSKKSNLLKTLNNIVQMVLHFVDLLNDECKSIIKTI